MGNKYETNINLHAGKEERQSTNVSSKVNAVLNITKEQGA
jgi:hypothetical protein